MTKYGSAAVKISITSASNTTALHDISQYVDEFNGVEIEAILQNSHAFGDAWEESLHVGVSKVNPLTIGGYYDDVAASGPHALFGQISQLGKKRTVEVDFGASDIVASTVVISKYSRAAKRGELTRYQVELQPSGAPTTAS